MKKIFFGKEIENDYCIITQFTSRQRPTRCYIVFTASYDHDVQGGLISSGFELIFYAVSFSFKLYVMTKRQFVKCERKINAVILNFLGQTTVKLNTSSAFDLAVLVLLVRMSNSVR